ncbi:S4 domain-containing protein YaaA, partial [Enterococcus faecalis]|nr:S4 domain-containing protein YaaA [Enterococcus faecalis]
GLYAGMMSEIPEEGTFFMGKNGNESDDAAE